MALAIVLPSVLVLALIPPEQTSFHQWNDKLQHLLAFSTITLLVDAVWPRLPFGVKKAGFVFAYGVCIEVMQSQTDYRTPSVADLMANSGGILLYWLAIPVLKKIPVVRLRWQQGSE